ncbi:2'-5' RNA ligase family protein [Hymenobacter mucosus]|uniref:2'-5' RNA ligase n=1 Tax=Hymenobacter mucosus TaxID=1411120 RepID=A0A238VF35_9BACT|nr:mutarotase [Hymenobacter mucosus]SNR32119.1 hypothetical protein SAMN06269173_101466 [Hymenobacter mucosus]
MSLQDHYDAMRTTAFSHFIQGKAELDPLLTSGEDTRRGITLLARPPGHILATIERVLADFQKLDPTQYYYPASDIHLTILSIISCHSGFTLSQADPTAYQDLVRTVLRKARPFTVRYTGLTASPGGIIVQGFLEDDSLEKLRSKIRMAFLSSGLQQSIDQRYTIQTAHSTVVRFIAPLPQPEGLVTALQNYRSVPIGLFEVDALELVYNDWYQRAANTVLLEHYSLTPN